MKSVLSLIVTCIVIAGSSAAQALNPLQGGENAATAFILSGSLPIISTGTTDGYLDDYNEECGFVGSGSPDVVYAFTPLADLTADLDLCGSSYDTRLYVYEIILTPGFPFACNDDFYYNFECGFYVSKIENVYLEAGNTYYIVVDGYTEMDYGDYVLTIDETDAWQCVWGIDLACPPWAVEENETCGDDANGGCDMDPVTRAWEAVPSTGATFCGTNWAVGGVRDTDWYELVLTEDSYVSLTADANGQILYGLVETTTPGEPDCSTLTGEINPSNFAGPCFETFIDLGVLAAGTYWFYVEMAVDDGFPCENHYRIEFAVNAVPCASPEALSASTITSTSAELSWIESGTAITWEYEYVPALSTPTETGILTNSNPVTIPGLSSNTTYDFYVRSVCGEQFSAWTGPFTFTTACSGPFALPWSESFEGTWPPPCWTDPEALDFGWDQSTQGTERSGWEWAYCNKAGSALITPGIALTADSWLVFWYRAENSAYPQDLIVSIGDEDIYQVLGNTSEMYQLAIVSLASYTGQTINVTFTGGSGTGGVDYGICMDDVSLKQEYLWTGNLSTDWNNPANWSLPDTPDQNSVVIIPSSPSGGLFPEVNNGITAECYHITVSPGASVTVKTGGSLNVVNP
jgi:hypothetical protein